MARVQRRWLPEIFTVVVLVLVAYGVLMTYSSSVRFAQDVFGNRLHFFYRELLWVAIGLAGALVCRSFHYQRLQGLSWLLLFLATGLLVLVYVPGFGRTVNNATRWLAFGGLTIQPSEIAKYAIIVFVADRLARNRRHVDRFVRGVLVPLLVVLVPVALITAEPDLGTPVLILATVFIMLFVAGTRTRHLLLLGAAAIPAVVLLVLKYPYRVRRLFAFLRPDADPLGAGFQINQSLIAVGSGRLKGLGLGNSVQKMHYLPEAHTDFVFAIIGEELGFLGTALLILLFLVFLYCIYRMSLQVKEMFGHLVIVGVMAMLGLQMVVNIAVVTACLPTKGLALPFISYGGSSLVMTLAACGLLLNIIDNQARLRGDFPRVRSSDSTIV